MNYIETILLRQEAFWSALVSGEVREPEEVAESDSWWQENLAAAELPWEAGKRLARAETGGRFESAAREGESQGGEAAAAGMQSLMQALEERGRWAREQALEPTGQGRELPWGETGLAGRRVASHADTAQAQPRLPETEEGGGAEDNGLRALSLALERDTRRFDGGFSLY